MPRGLADLVGRRDPLSDGDSDAFGDSASWTPAAPWLAGRNLSALFPASVQPGTGEEDCDASSYTEAITAPVQAALWETQNPDDCAGARYLVLDQSYPSGLGSSVRIHMYMLSLAIR